MIATASLPIHLDRVRAPVAPVATVAARQPRGTAAHAAAGLNVSRPIVPWRWRTAIVDAVELIAVVWSIPFVIVAVGAPVALAIVALLWLARWVLGAF
jgi:hypothetical protein